jgi:hypothetical protein
MESEFKKLAENIRVFVRIIENTVDKAHAATTSRMDALVLQLEETKKTIARSACASYLTVRLTYG